MEHRVICDRCDGTGINRWAVGEDEHEETCRRCDGEGERWGEDCEPGGEDEQADVDAALADERRAEGGVSTELLIEAIVAAAHAIDGRDYAVSVLCQPTLPEQVRWSVTLTELRRGSPLTGSARTLRLALRVLAAEVLVRAQRAGADHPALAELAGLTDHQGGPTVPCGVCGAPSTHEVHNDPSFVRAVCDEHARPYWPHSTPWRSDYATRRAAR